MEKYKVVGLFTGRPKPLGPKNTLSAIDKSSVAFLTISKDGIEGDEVANLKYHGGQDRVVHHYSLKNYQHLQEKFPNISDRFVPGSYGENITTAGLTEADLCIGDIFKLGTVKLQITEGRKPCGTIDLKYEAQGILKEVVSSGHYGWFYKVLEEGRVDRGDELVFLERPYPRLNLKKLIFEMFKAKSKDLDFLSDAYNCPALSLRWKELLSKWQ